MIQTFFLVFIPGVAAVLAAFGLIWIAAKVAQWKFGHWRAERDANRLQTRAQLEYVRQLEAYAEGASNLVAELLTHQRDPLYVLPESTQEQLYNLHAIHKNIDRPKEIS